MDEEDYIPSSHRLASQLGVQAQNVQMMKASFFGDEEDEELEPETGMKQTFVSLPLEISRLPVIFNIINEL